MRTLPAKHDSMLHRFITNQSPSTITMTGRASAHTIIKPLPHPHTPHTRTPPPLTRHHTPPSLPPSASPSPTNSGNHSGDAATATWPESRYGFLFDKQQFVPPQSDMLRSAQRYQCALLMWTQLRATEAVRPLIITRDIGFAILLKSVMVKPTT